MFARALFSNTSEAFQTQDQSTTTVTSGVVTAAIVIDLVLFIWTLVSVISVCCNSRLGLRCNYFLFVVFSVCHTVFAVVSLVHRDWASSCVGVAVALAGVIGARLCQRCAAGSAMADQPDAAAVSKMDSFALPRPPPMALPPV
jgi:hypothetical protein